MNHLLRINRKIGGIVFYPSITCRDAVAKFANKKQQPNMLCKFLAVVYGGPDILIGSDETVVARRYSNGVTLFNRQISAYSGSVMVDAQYYSRFLPNYLVELANGYDGYSTHNSFQNNIIISTYKEHIADWRTNVDLVAEMAKVKEFTEGLGEEIVF